MPPKRAPHQARATEIIVQFLKGQIRQLGTAGAREIPMGFKGENAKMLMNKIRTDSQFKEHLQALAEPKTWEEVATPRWWGWQLELANTEAGIGKKRRSGDPNVPIGAVTKSMKRDSAKGSAIASNQQKEGLHLLFGGNTDLALAVFAALEQGKDSADIPGHWQHFDEATARGIAIKQVTAMLGLLSAHNGTSLNEILGNGGLDRLNNLSMADMHAMARRQVHKLKADEFETRELFHLEGLAFGTFANILVYFSDIVYALTNRICAVLECSDGTLRFPTMVGATMDVENCIGAGTVQQGRDPNDFEQEWTTDGRYALDMFGTDVYDLDVKSNPTKYNHKENNPLQEENDPAKFKKIMFGTGRYIRLLEISTRSVNGLITHEVDIRDNDGKSAKRKHHRLLQIVAHHNGVGVRNSHELSAHLKGKTLEQAYPYLARDERAYTRRLESKGWLDVVQAQWCDVDHLVGRSKSWMNALLFTMPVSHRYNSCLSYIRSECGFWGYAGTLMEYNGGN